MYRCSRSLLSSCLSRIAVQRIIGGAVCNSSSSCLSLSSKFQSLSLNNYIKPTTPFTHKPLGFSANTSFRLFSKGKFTTPSSLSLSTIFSFVFASSFFYNIAGSKKPTRRSSGHRFKVDKDDKDEPKKLSSVAKRACQSANRRIYNRAQKSLVRIRVKKVLLSYFSGTLLMVYSIF